jgi:branched-subunit amino acid transport protein
MNMPDSQIWMLIGLIGIGTFLIRFSFIGLIGDRQMPAWVLRYLRYTPVAVLPGLVAPLVLWPAATDGALDAPRLLAAGVTVFLGLVFKNTLLAIFGGAATLFLGLLLLG